jgi:hypothetical protein
MISSRLMLLEYRAELSARASPSPEWAAYIASENIDLTVYAFIGILGVTQARFSPDRRFKFCDDGVPTAVCEVLGDDAETVIDLVAWPIARPEKFATALGVATGLGKDQAKNPATFFAGRPLLIHRTPLSWIRSGCRGVVVLDRLMAPVWLGAALGPIAGEDLAHGHELARLLYPHVSASRILAPLRQAAA